MFSDCLQAGKETAGPCPSRRAQRFCVTPCHNTRGMWTALPTVIKTLLKFSLAQSRKGNSHPLQGGASLFCSQEFLPRGDNPADGDFAKRSTRFAIVGATYLSEVIKTGDSQITPHRAADLPPHSSFIPQATAIRSFISKSFDSCFYLVSITKNFFPNIGKGACVEERVRETYRHFKTRSWLAFPCLVFSFLKVPSFTTLPKQTC